MHHYTGTITGPTDHAGLDVGERCDVWVTPNPGNPGLNCRWYIDCGEPRQRIYGGGSVAAWLCELMAPGGSVLATDLDATVLAELSRPNLDIRVHDVRTDELPTPPSISSTCGCCWPGWMSQTSCYGG